MLSTEWQKSPASAGMTDCVEARLAGMFVEVRNSHRPHGIIWFTQAEWQAFLAAPAETFALPAEHA